MQNYFETNPAPLLAADFDYFRIPRERWELMLLRLKQMGVNALTITVPWGFHEFQQGTVDLNGVTSARRNVTGLLKLAAAFHLSCLLKPGPYSDNGLLGDGLPAWLVNQDNLEAALPLAVESWYKAFSRALTSQQWPTGPVIALVIEAEPPGNSPLTLDRQLIEVKWRVWLRKRYEGIEALNAAYGVQYRTVNEVEFPPTWAKADTPVEQDAQTFLDEVRGDRLTGYADGLVKAGWQIPIYPVNTADLPIIQSYNLAAAELSLEGGKKRAKKRAILNLQQPIRVDPDPVEIGRSPAWAELAPIRADGSVRPRFWQVRGLLWSQAWPKAALEGKILGLAFKDSLLVTAAADTPVKIETTAAKLATYRLKFNSDLTADNNLKVSRGNFSGLYAAADDTGQTDLVMGLNDSSLPLSGFLMAYLTDILTAQAQALIRSATLAERLGQMLTADASPAAPAETGHRAPTSYTLAEARRGLHEADAALRKAMASIGALEGGFDTILDKGPATIPQPASGPVAISPEIFEGEARNILIEIGAVCAKIAPWLQLAATTLQQTIDAASFTVEQYRQSRAGAIAAAREANESLLVVIARLRFEITAERLPLVVWRIHDQVQAIVESLRWGALH